MDKHLCHSSGIRQAFARDQGALQCIDCKSAEQTQRLLLATSKALREIAVEVGFNTSDYFCRAFKKEIGIIPSQFQAERVR